ncbi:MAG: sugar phosphate isomerase/epimerase family protein [Chloroflexota bacterium]
MANLIAFHSGALGHYPATDAIARIARAGYAGVELNAETLPWAQPHVTPATGNAERRAIRRAAAETGLAITSLSAHIGLVSTDPGERRAAVEFSKGCVDLALDLGTNTIHGLTGIVPDGVEETRAWDWALAAIDEITAYAESRGVAYGIEPVVGMLIASGAGMARLVAALPDRKVGMNYDPSHLQVAGDDPATEARRFGARIVAVHLKDAKGTPGNFSFPPLGEGAVDFVTLAQALREVGYAGAVAVEYEAQAFGYTLSEDEILRDGLAFARRYFG